MTFLEFGVLGVGLFLGGWLWRVCFYFFGGSFGVLAFTGRAIFTGYLPNGKNESFVGIPRKEKERFSLPKKELYLLN